MIRFCLLKYVLFESGNYEVDAKFIDFQLLIEDTILLVEMFWSGFPHPQFAYDCINDWVIEIIVNVEFGNV